MKIKVSVVIPVYNSHEELRRCLNALWDLELESGGLEIIVIDNGSTTSLSDFQQFFPGIRIIEEPTPGSYAARNAGVRVASGEILTFTDADCVPRKDWMKNGILALKTAKDAAVVGGAVHMFIPEGRRRTPAALYDLCFGLRQEKYWSEDGFLITANLFVPSTVFREVGLFRTDVFSGGDAEWSRRVVERGYALQYAPGAVVEHPVRADWRSLRRKVLRIAQGGSDPVYQAALDRSRWQRRGRSGKLAAARRVLQSGELRNWRERTSVFLMALVVVLWKLEGKLRYRLNRETYR